MLVALMVGSLHHIFTRIGPPNLSTFVVLRFVALAVFTALVMPVRLSGGELRAPGRL